MKKRFFSFLLSLCMVLMLLPVTAFAEEPESIDITITGFEVGKTPADCEITIIDSSLKSYIVEEVSWQKCDEEGNSPMKQDAVFEADTPYEIWLLIGSDIPVGTITSLPAVTVNGKTASVTYEPSTGEVCFDIRCSFELGMTIDGPDAVCAQQDYEFTVTAAKGLSISEFSYTVGEAKYTGSITEQDGVLYGLIPASAYASDVDSFTLSVTGTAPGGETATDSKTVKVIPDHNFAHGVCTICGAQQEFTLSVPFTTTVELGGNTAPGETTFDLAIVGANAGEERYADVTVSGTVTTDGAGDYTGTLTLTGPADQLWNMLCEGAFVQQVNAGEEVWTYDDTVWGLLLSQFVASSSANSAEYTMLILPATCKETDDGVYYDLDWEAESLDEMSFTNIYTKSTTKPAEPTESTRQTTNNTNTEVTTSVQTGDNSNLMLWLVLFAVSAVGAIGTGVYNKRRRNSRTK